MSYDAIKSERGLCSGTRPGLAGKCNGQLFECECGNVGCRQTYDNACSNQAYSAGFRCTKCGAVGKAKPVSYEYRIGA